MSELLAAAGAAVAGAAAGPGLAALARSTLRRGRLGRRATALMSVAAAIAAAAVVLRWVQEPLLLPGLLLFVAAGVALSAVDLAEHRLPDVLVLPAAGGVVVLLAAGGLLSGHPAVPIRAVLGAIALAAVYLLLAVVGRGRMGMGDVKSGLVAGAVTGALGLQTWLLGLVAGVVLNGLAAALLLLTRRGSLSSSVPFGPSIFAGALLAVLLR